MNTTSDLIERLSAVQRSARRDRATAHGLSLAQWDALRYLGICNRFSDTPAAVAAYLLTTRGTASQSLKVLERKGFVERIPDTGDRRVQHVRLTARGRALVDASETDPVDEASSADRGSLTDGLTGLLRDVQRASGNRTFGVCGTCRHLQGRAGDHRCGVTHEPLSSDDTRRICVEHSPAA